MFIYIVAIGFAILTISLLFAEREVFLRRGMSERFYNLFTVSYVCFIICCFVSRIVALCFFVPYSLAAPVLCLNRFKGEVWQIDKFSYILAAISIGTLALCSYQLYNCYNLYPDYDYSFLALLVFAISTPSFYFVTCRKQLDYMKETDEEMAIRKSSKNYGCSTYLMPLFIATFIMVTLFDTTFEDICKEKIYRNGRIYFYSEITDVAVSTYYGSKGRRYLEYEVTTDYILSETHKPYVFTERGGSGSVDGKFHYKNNPEKFLNSPFVPNSKIIMERSYFDKRVFSVVDKHPMLQKITNSQRPIVEKDSKKYYLDTYADIDFLKDNLEFYYHYCGLNFVVKAVIADVEGDNIIYYSPVLANKIYHHPKPGNDIDTLLFFKTLSNNDTVSWACLNNSYQTPENRNKISDCGYFFNGKIWSKEEFEAQVGGLEMLGL